MSEQPMHDQEEGSSLVLAERAIQAAYEFGFDARDAMTRAEPQPSPRRMTDARFALVEAIRRRSAVGAGAPNQQQEPGLSRDAAQQMLTDFWNAVCEWNRKNERNNKHSMRKLSAAYERAQAASDAILAHLAPVPDSRRDSAAG